MLRVLALDFDGVISDSAPECFVTALRSYVEGGSGGRFAAMGEAFDGAGLPTLAEVRAHPLYSDFLAAMPLGNRAEDFGVSLAALESGCALADQAAYDRFAASRSAAWLQEFHERFYRVRAALRRADPEGWLQLVGPYPSFVELLRRRARDATLAIATAKDRESVRLLLRAYGVEDLFDDDRIFDKEVGVSKAEHLTRLRERVGCGFGEITFVDDKVNHLDVAASLGVRCALAGWGFNGEREVALAERAGYLVCSLDDVESRLFDGAPRRSVAAGRGTRRG